MRCVANALSLLWLGWTCALAAGDDHPSTLGILAEARALVDNYYGDRRELAQAARLIGGILAAPKPPSDAFVQAARVTLKGGHIVGDEFEADTPRIANHLIDQALEADPDNVRAMSIKAEILMIDHRDLPGALVFIKKGLSRQVSYPWLHLALARYDEETRDYRAALSEYVIVIHGGCSNTDQDQHRAYGSALVGAAFLMGKQEDLTRQYAHAADECRNPKDAWILGDFAQLFGQKAMFDDAIVYARKALGVMDYGVARQSLAMALYGRAAQLSTLGRDPTSLLAEANGMGFGRERAVSWFEDSRAEAHAFAPAVAALVQGR